MALEVSYWSGYDPISRQCYGTNVGRASASLTASSISLGTVPSNAAIARLTAGEACVVSNNGVDASATNGVYLAAGDTIDLQVTAGTPLEGMTA